MRTNNVRANRQMRPGAEMAGFLVTAMAIPEVFGAWALTFGPSYLFVVVLHLGAFSTAPSDRNFIEIPLAMLREFNRPSPPKL